MNVELLTRYVGFPMDCFSEDRKFHTKCAHLPCVIGSPLVELSVIVRQLTVHLIYNDPFAADWRYTPNRSSYDHGIYFSVQVSVDWMSDSSLCVETSCVEMISNMNLATWIYLHPEISE